MSWLTVNLSAPLTRPPDLTDMLKMLLRRNAMADDGTPILEIDPTNMVHPPRVRVVSGHSRRGQASNDYKRIHSVTSPISKEETDKLIRIHIGVIKGLLESQGHDVTGIEKNIESAIQLNKNVTADAIKNTVITTANQASAGAGNAQTKLEQSLRAQGLDPRDPLVERALKLYGNLNPSELHNAVERLRRAERGDTSVLGSDGVLRASFGDVGGSGTSTRYTGNMSTGVATSLSNMSYSGSGGVSYTVGGTSGNFSISGAAGSPNFTVTGFGGQPTSYRLAPNDRGNVVVHPKLYDQVLRPSYGSGNNPTANTV
jgi:hypothetical protein